MHSQAEIQLITKLGAARRQLVTAIRLFFDDREPVSVHTLAHASWRIIRDLCNFEERVTFLEVHAAKHDLALRDVYARARQFRNFFEHAKEDPNAEIEFSDELNDDALAAATLDLFELCNGKLPVEAWALIAWFTAMYPDSIPREDETVRFWRKVAADNFPRIREKSRSDQKRMAVKCIDRFLSDDTILGHNKVDRTQVGFWN